MESLNLLDCIAHGTTPAEFLRTFKKVDDAVEYLANFYIENGGDASSDEIEDAKSDAREQLSIIYAMSVLGKRKSPRKAKSSANNGLSGGRPAGSKNKPKATTPANTASTRLGEESASENESKPAPSG